MCTAAAEKQREANKTWVWPSSLQSESPDRRVMISRSEYTYAEGVLSNNTEVCGRQDSGRVRGEELLQARATYH